TLSPVSRHPATARQVMQANMQRRQSIVDAKAAFLHSLAEPAGVAHDRLDGGHELLGLFYRQIPGIHSTERSLSGTPVHYCFSSQRIINRTTTNLTRLPR